MVGDGFRVGFAPWVRVLFEVSVLGFGVWFPGKTVQGRGLLCQDGSPGTPRPMGVRVPEK